MISALTKRITDYLSHRHEFKKIDEIQVWGEDKYPDYHKYIFQCKDTSCAKVRKIKI